MIVSIVCNLVDLLGAGTFSKTSAEFSNEEWYTESIGVCLPLGESSSVEVLALSGMCNLGFPIGALTCRHLATVSVVI